MIWSRIKFGDEFKTAFYSDDDFSGVKEDVEKEIAAAYQVDKIKCVIRGEGEELVLVAVVGSDIHNFINEFAKRAKSTGFKTIRFNTIRAGIPKLVQKSGYQAIELDTNFRVIL